MRVHAGELGPLDGEVANDLEQEFASRGSRRGGVLMLSAPVAYDFIEAARMAAQPVLGVDCFMLTESTTMSPLEHILDLSGAVAAGGDTWQEARRFVEERELLGFVFEVVI